MAQPERHEAEPIINGGYVTAVNEIKYENPELVIPQGTKGIVKERINKHSFLIIWPQAFNSPRATDEKIIMRA